MSIIAKIAEGTRSDSTDLCKSCRYSTIIKGSRESQERRFCSELSGDLELNHKVSECNSYYNKNLPSLKTFYDQAWILSTDKQKRIGFSPYKKWKEDNGEDERIYE